MASSEALASLLTSLSWQPAHVFISFSSALRLGNFFENCCCSGKFSSFSPICLVFFDVCSLILTFLL